MGRWAQQRKRGSSRDVAVTFPLSPPQPEDWAVTQDGDADQFVWSITAGRPDGADGQAVRWRIVLLEEPWSQEDPSVDDEGFVSTGDAGLTLVVEMAWFLGIVQVSDWSETKNVDL